MIDQKNIEFYPTPEDLAEFLVRQLLEKLPSDFNKQPRTILEPSAGAGSFVKAIQKVLPKHTIVAIDPNHDIPNIPGVLWDQVALETLHRDLAGDRPFDLACGNPPFSLAEKHLRSLLSIVRHDGHIGFLLRSGFLSSKGRADFFQKHPPKHVFILAARPSFVASHTCKKDSCRHKWITEPKVTPHKCPKCSSEGASTSRTDQYDYMFAIWQVGFTGETTMSWLNF